MTEVFDAVSIIAAKRDGKALTDGQIDWVIDRFTSGEVADYQMSALAMAIFLNGMDRREIARWTAAMIASGTSDTTRASATCTPSGPKNFEIARRFTSCVRPESNSSPISSTAALTCRSVMAPS